MTVGTGIERSVAVADFNGNGSQDVVTANAGNNNVSILLGNGSGGFTQPSDPFAVGSNPLAVVVGDFNGDGHQDIAVANEGDNTVTVLLGNGHGVFQAAAGSPFAAGTGPISLALGDFNGDGFQDLAAANFLANQVTVLLGNGSGGFAPATGSPFTVGTNPIDVVVGDFNGDGKQDLATANYNGNNVTVLMGNGSGGFTPATGSPFAAGTGAYYIAIGDFTRDGIQDLAVANYYDNDVTVLVGNGNGTFTADASGPFGLGTNPVSLATGDFNGDGFQDLVSADHGSGTLTVLLGNGAGNFHQANGSPFVAGTSPWSVLTGDFNGDGVQDLAVTDASDGQLNVFLGTLMPTTSVLSTTSPLTITFGATVPLSVAVSDSTTPFQGLTGAVNFLDGSNVLGAASQSTSPFTFTTPMLNVGSHALSAVYSGGTGSAASTSNIVNVLVQNTQTISFPGLSNVSILVAPFSISATARFRIDGHFQFEYSIGLQGERFYGHDSCGRHLFDHRAAGRGR